MKTPLTIVAMSLACWLSSPAAAAPLVRYEFNTSGSFAPTTVTPGVTASDLLKGPGVSAAYWSSGTIAANSNAISDSLTTAISAGDYYEVQLTPPSGQSLSLTSFSFTYAATAGIGINYWARYYGRSSVEGFGVNMSGATWPKEIWATANPNSATVTVTLGAGYADLTETISFRIYMTDRGSFDGSSHQARIDNIQVDGEVVPEPAALALTLLLPVVLSPRRDVCSARRVRDE